MPIRISGPVGSTVVGGGSPPKGAVYCISGDARVLLPVAQGLVHPSGVAVSGEGDDEVEIRGFKQMTYIRLFIFVSACFLQFDFCCGVSVSVNRSG